MSQSFDAAFDNASILLRSRMAADRNPLTEQEVAEAAVQGIVVARILFPGAEAVDQDELERRLLAQFETSIGTPLIICSHDQHVDWYDKARATQEWPFWNRYMNYMAKVVRIPAASVSGIDEATDDIMRNLEDPLRKGAWDRRGLVVGHVQSGKTANYIGLMNKAVDAGYKLIIVLAGMHNSLRSQTQIRIEEGLTGRSSAAKNRRGTQTVVVPVGVGEYQLNARFAVNAITSRDENGDFSRIAVRTTNISPGQDPLVMVIKKNGSVLKNIVEWIRGFANFQTEKGEFYVADVPILLIDDEADQATIDTRKPPRGADPDDYNPTVINGRIREILKLFERSAYVGYTATPFANVLIGDQRELAEFGQDLFPRSFILSLPTPSDYCGPAKIFGTSTTEPRMPGMPVVRPVADHAATMDQDERVGWIPPKHKKDHVPAVDGRPDLPPSLKEAIRAYLLACAAKRVRGLPPRNSMLVHVTRFVDVQKAVGECIGNEVAAIRHDLRYGGDLGTNPELMVLKALWERDFVPTTRAVCSGPHAELARLCTPVDWDSVRECLHEVANSVRIYEINGTSSDVLDYTSTGSDGWTVIAVGGDKLSRGLTLEGLTVSYFLRASRMYDTLMQMGRWFGYRKGYVDLCRLYTTEDLAEWYAHIADASEELNEDFKRMCKEKRTPKDFGHRVRSHPTLMVTSAIKMRDGTKMTVEFSNTRVETTNFYRSATVLVENWETLQRHVNRITGAAGPEMHRTGALIWRGVLPAEILTYLHEYKLHPASRKINLGHLVDYIRKENSVGRLLDWSVVVASGEGETCDIGANKVQTVLRKWDLSGAGIDELEMKRALIEGGRFRMQGINDPSTEALHLDADERALVTKYPPSSVWLRENLGSGRGILTVYPVSSRDRERGEAGDATKCDFVEPAGVPIIGFVMSLPVVEGGGSKVDYVVNSVYKSELEETDE